MLPGFMDYDGPPDGVATAVLGSTDGTRTVLVSLPDVRHGIRVAALCERCGHPASTGMTVAPGDLPLARAGRWRHECGGEASLPDAYVVTDRETGSKFDLFARPSDPIVVSAVTLAELLRLGQVARAVQQGRPGADERLERALSEAPEPIRQLSERWTREQKLTLASVIIALVALLVPLIKDEGGVTQEQLVKVIEQVVEQISDGASHQGEAEESRTGGAGDAGTDERGTAADPLGGGRDGSAPEVQRDQGIGDPDQ